MAVVAIFEFIRVWDAYPFTLTMIDDLCWLVYYIQRDLSAVRCKIAGAWPQADATADTPDPARLMRSWPRAPAARMDLAEGIGRLVCPRTGRISAWRTGVGKTRSGCQRSGLTCAPSEIHWAISAARRRVVPEKHLAAADGRGGKGGVR